MSTYFQDCWIDDPQFNSWLEKHANDNKSAKCKKCKVSISLSNMGRRALLSHMDGKKHKDNSKSISCFFKPVSAKETDNNPTCSTATKQKQVILSCDETDKTKAEIYWVLNVVSNSFSLNSSGEMDKLFQKMFPDSEIAAKYQMGRTKLGYIINFGLAPYFHSILMDDIKQSPYFSISFDESLNNIFQTCQMDLIIRYWSEKKNQVEVRYFATKFLGHPTAKNLLHEFNQTLENINKQCLIHVSMDGPSTNWCFYNLLCAQRDNEDNPKMLNIGSCGLHVIHGAFKVGAQSITWNVKSILKSCYILFHDSPARRADYISITGSQSFPLSFCSTRWIEDKKVADRVISIWENIKATVKFWKSLAKSKQPQCKSYETVVNAVKDELTISKLQFFSYIAGLLQPFLTKYQTNWPMIPYYFDDFMKLSKTLMIHIVKPDALRSITSGNHLQKFDFYKKENMLPTINVSFGFAAENTIKDLKKNDQVTAHDIKSFIKDTKTLIIKMLEKLFERGLIGSALLKCASSIDPENLLTKSQEVCMQRMKNLLHNMLSLKQITTNQCDVALHEFSIFLQEKFTTNLAEFKSFDKNSTRLDDFYFDKLKLGSKFKELPRIIKIILTLNHGQAAVERGFSVNSSMLVENMNELSLISRRKVKDYLTSYNLKPYEVEIPLTMIRSVRTANAKYKLHLEEQSKEKNKEQENTQLVRLNEEIADLQQKRKVLTEICDTYNKEFVECAKNAGEQDDVVKMKVLLSKGNVLKRKSEENEKEIFVIDSTLVMMLEKRKCFGVK